MLKKIALLTVIAAAGMMSASAEPLNYNVISLSASARESIKRDTMQVGFVIQESGRDRQSVSNTVTERSNRVLQAARARKALEIELSSRNAYPYYIDGNPKKGQVWQDTVQITVLSKDFEALSRLIATVQNDAAINNLGFIVSRDLQDATQKKLTEAAIRNFREQAQNITRALGANNYKIVTLNINNGSFSGYQPMRAESSMKLAAPAEASIPDVETGKEDIQMEVSGTIQIQ